MFHLITCTTLFSSTYRTLHTELRIFCHLSTCWFAFMLCHVELMVHKGRMKLTKNKQSAVWEILIWSFLDSIWTNPWSFFIPFSISFHTVYSFLFYFIILLIIVPSYFFYPSSLKYLFTNIKFSLLPFYLYLPTSLTFILTPNFCPFISVFCESALNFSSHLCPHLLIWSQI